MNSDRLSFFAKHAGDDAVATTAAGGVTAVAMAEASSRLAQRLDGATALGCLCASRYHVALTLLAALRLGVPCLMPHDHSIDTVRRLRHGFTGIRLVADRPAFDGDGAFRVDGQALGGEVDGGSALPAFPGDQLAALVFTSGSTGTPAVHEKPWEAFAQIGRYLGERLALRRRTQLVATVAGQHMYGIEASIMLALQGHGVLHASQPLFPADIVAALEAAEAPRGLVTTPFHLRSLLRSGVRLPGLEFVLSATAPLDPALAQAAESALEAPLLEIYGATEAGTVATRWATAEERWSPCPGIRLTATETQTWVEADHLPGRVALADRIGIDADGRFALRGRCSDVLNVAGKRGSLGDVTAKLLAVAGVEDAVVHAPDELESGTIRRLVAFVVAPQLTAADIARALRGRVDAAFLPRPIVRVDALPRNGAGKVPRSELERLFAQRVAGAQACPETANE